MKPFLRSFSIGFVFIAGGINAQTLIDSIPYPGQLSLNFWGIHVTADTIFLGADGPGAIYFSDHDGNLMGNLPTGYTYNHGLIKRPASYLIAEDYSTSGALLHEIDLSGQLINEWVFPPGILGISSGIGDLEDAGDGAVWFTMYYPDSDVYPYAYAYKWLPGSTTFLDTVPLQGQQPYGLTVKGDTLLYVIDDNDDDMERIHAYDLTNEEDLFYIDLPDTPIDNDQRPFGLHYYDGLLYLIANRQGGSAFAHQTIFIYSFDPTVGISDHIAVNDLVVHPNPADGALWFELLDEPGTNSQIQVFDAQGRLILRETARFGVNVLSVKNLIQGIYMIKV
ncbi:MAG: T9SS type A sorting domain-containing protein, partial [Bacteroidota bacterium]|nr:T9SS type A sorting domain-containing protein [Bacteroidota bacterium]